MQTRGKVFDQTIATWIKELERYSFAELSAKPSATGWSMGQLYIHLINATRYFIKQAQVGATANDNATKEASANAHKMFLNNEFPDALLEGPPSNADTLQPVSKNQLAEELKCLNDEINKVEFFIVASHFKGKTKHFGLGYFTAGEWLQFAEMHFRHHLRQKKRIDEFLKESNI